MSHILVIDNYDSFTFNLVHYLMELGADVRVERNDAMSAAEVLALSPEGVLSSPGPKTPEEAGISLDLVAACADSAMPLLGVCLGHQCLGDVEGGEIVRAPELVHGKTSMIHHTGVGVFTGLPNPFEATRYHSLVVDRDSVPEATTATRCAPRRSPGARSCPDLRRSETWAETRAWTSSCGTRLRAAMWRDPGCSWPPRACRGGPICVLHRNSIS